MTVKELLSSLDKMGKSLLRGYFRSEMTCGTWSDSQAKTIYPTEEEAAQKAWDRMKDHYEKGENGKYKQKTGHSYDPVSGSWTVDMPQTASVDASRVCFDENEVRTVIDVSVDFSGGEKKTWHPIAMAGTWKHPRSGSINITEKDLEELAKNFSSKKIGQDVPIDEGEGHVVERDGAFGWIEQVKVVGDELVGLISWNDKGVEAIEGDRYRYISPRLYVDGRKMTLTETGEQVSNVLASVSLTNHPIFTGQPKLTVDMSEYSFDEDEPNDKEDQDMPTTDVEEDVGAGAEDVETEEDVDEEVETEEEDVEEEEEDMEDDEDVDGATMSQIANRMAGMEAQIAALTKERDASRSATIKAELGGLTFARTEVRTVDGQPRNVRIRQRFSPATLDLIGKITAELGPDSELGIEFSKAVKRGGFEMVALEDEVGVTFSSGPADDSTWLEGLEYTEKRKEDIRNTAAAQKISLREAHDLVMTPRTR